MVIWSRRLLTFLNKYYIIYLVSCVLKPEQRSKVMLTEQHKYLEKIGEYCRRHWFLVLIVLVILVSQSLGSLVIVASLGLFFYTSLHLVTAPSRTKTVIQNAFLTIMLSLFVFTMGVVVHLIESM